MAVKKKRITPDGKKLVTVYLDTEELATYKSRAKANGLTLSRYFAHLARRETLGENKDLRLYTETDELKARLRDAIDKSNKLYNRKK